MKVYLRILKARFNWVKTGQVILAPDSTGKPRSDHADMECECSAVHPGAPTNYRDLLSPEVQERLAERDRKMLEEAS